MFKIYDGEYLSYFYIIQHKPSGKLYAGCRYAKDCNPKELLQKNGYCTSSTTVNTLILQDGLSSFEIIEIRLFKSKWGAYFWESAFLQGYVSYCSNSFLNKSYNTACRYPEHRLDGTGYLLHKALVIPEVLNNYYKELSC